MPHAHTGFYKIYEFLIPAYLVMIFIMRLFSENEFWIFIWLGKVWRQGKYLLYFITKYIYSTYILPGPAFPNVVICTKI